MSTGIFRISIRRAELNDLDTVAELCNKTFHEVEGDYIPSQNMTAAEAGEGGPFFVAVQSTGEIVGCVQFRPNPGGPFSLAVLPQFRDKGIGRQLMIKVEQHAVGLKYRTLKTGIVNFRERQLFPYYQRLGYVKTNKTHDLEGTPYHLIEIHKIIS